MGMSRRQRKARNERDERNKKPQASETGGLRMPKRRPILNQVSERTAPPLPTNKGREPKRTPPPTKPAETESVPYSPFNLKDSTSEGWDPTSEGWKLTKTVVQYICSSFHYGHRYYRYGDKTRYHFFYEAF